jgi:hypothetical protein
VSGGHRPDAADRLTAAIRAAMRVPSGIITADRSVPADRFAAVMRRVGAGPVMVLEDGMRFELLDPGWPWPEVTPRQLTELRVLIEQLLAADAQATGLRVEIEDCNADRHLAVRPVQLATAARTESLFLEIGQAREYEEAVRTELAAAHARAVATAQRRRTEQGQPPLADPAAEARAEHRRAIAHEQETRVQLERAYALPGQLHRVRRLAAFRLVATLVALAVIVAVAAAGLSTGPLLLFGLIAVGIVAGMEASAVYARTRAIAVTGLRIPAVRARHGLALDRLVVAEAGMLAAGLPCVPSSPDPGVE